MKLERKIKRCSGNYSRPHGGTYFIAECPFCKEEVKCYPWSYASCGKRCPRCGALLHGYVATKAAKRKVAEAVAR